MIRRHPPRLVEGMLYTGTREIPYLRGGRGPGLVLLSGLSTPARERVIRRLARAHLVVDPGVPPPPELWPEWLDALIDGLGLDRPDLVVDPGLAEAAVSFILADPERGGRAVPLPAVDP